MQNTFIYPGSSVELRVILKNLNRVRLFLVTGKRSYIQSGAEAIFENYNNDYELYIFSDFQTNPNYEDVKRGTELFVQFKAEVIIAIGGGSTLDMGKLINYYHNCNTDNIPKSNFINERFDPVPIICIPTTAGSGSESTNFAVMYVNGIKYSIQHKNLLPHFVFIDPELHFSQTSYQKAVSGIDAFSQAVESLWSIKSTDESRTYAERSLKLIWENYYKVVHSHDNLAHLNMAVGANLAGKAINISNTTAPHALSYKITSLYGVPHGHAVALTLPLFFDYNFSCIPKICDLNLKKTLIEAKDTIFRILKCKSINEGKSKIERLILDAGLEMKLSKLGSRDKKDIKKIVEDVNQQRLSNNPYPVSGNSLINMLENIW